MENINFNFEKFVEDLEQRSDANQQRRELLQQQLDAWSARRRLNSMYRENPHNRIYTKK